MHLAPIREFLGFHQNIKKQRKFTRTAIFETYLLVEVNLFQVRLHFCSSNDKKNDREMHSLVLSGNTDSLS